jgi:hypothetical protein
MWMKLLRSIRVKRGRWHSGAQVPVPNSGDMFPRGLMVMRRRPWVVRTSGSPKYPPPSLKTSSGVGSPVELACASSCVIVRAVTVVEWSSVSICFRRLGRWMVIPKPRRGACKITAAKSAAACGVTHVRELPEVVGVAAAQKVVLGRESSERSA